MPKKIFKTLVGAIVIFCAIALGLTVLLQKFFDLDIGSIVINILTDFFGIGVTLFYVEKLLAEHERSRWNKVREQGTLRIQLFSFQSLTQILSMVDLKEKIDMNMVQYNDHEPIFLFEIEITEGLLEENPLHPNSIFSTKLRERLPEDDERLKIQKCIDEGYKIINLYISQLPPNTTELLHNSISNLEYLTALLKNISDLADENSLEINMSAFREAPKIQGSIIQIGAVIYETVEYLILLSETVADEFRQAE